MKKLSLLSLAAVSVLAIAPLSAWAQQAPAPIAQGPGAGRANLVQTQLTDTVTRYVVGPMGRARGLVLSHGTVVFAHSRDLATAVPLGTAVRVDGLINPAAPQSVYHASVYNSAGALLVEAHQRGQFAQGAPMQQAPQGAAPGMAQGAAPGMRQGWHHGRGNPEFRAQMRARVEALPTVQASGTVQSLLAGPRGHAHGALLSDGSTVVFPGGLARMIAQHGVRVGDTLSVSGHGTEGPNGRGLVAHQVTFADGSTMVAPAAPVAMAPQQ